MKKTDFLEFLKSKQACSDSQDWIKSLPVKNIGPKTWAKYLSEVQPGWVEWLAENIRGDITAKYLRVKDTALAEYKRVAADAAHKLLTFEAVSQVVDNFLKTF